eukprot:4730751-Amphidinium_carterae.1
MEFLVMLAFDIYLGVLTCSNAGYSQCHLSAEPMPSSRGKSRSGDSDPQCSFWKHRMQQNVVMSFS